MPFFESHFLNFMLLSNPFLLIHSLQDIRQVLFGDSKFFREALQCLKE